MKESKYRPFGVNSISDIPEVTIPNVTKLQNLTNKVFGLLTVVKYAGKYNTSHYWWAICGCGNSRPLFTTSSRLTCMKTKSCGCLCVGSIKHNLCKSSEYAAYQNMKNRCYNQNNHSYSDYGGRGVSICKEWLECFENFYLDMGDKPTQQHSIDRIDVNGNYCKENCRWATKKEQMNNIRTNLQFTVDGKQYSVDEVIVKYNLNIDAVYNRKKLGWSEDRLLNTPIRKRTKNSKDITNE